MNTSELVLRPMATYVVTLGELCPLATRIYLKSM
jgi:hypothetical protein